MWSFMKENVGRNQAAFIGNLIGPFFRKVIVTTVDITIKDEDQALVQRAARSLGKSLSEFVAEAAVEEAKRIESVVGKAAYEADDGPLTQEQKDHIRRVAKPLLPAGPFTSVRSLL